MTVEAAVPKTIFPSIAGIGPYAIGWPYGGTDVVVTVVKDGVRTVLTGADFSLSPTSSATAGSVFLTPAAATTHAGGQLIAERLTPEEQGWSGVYPGEKGIEAQLDRTTRRIQELSRQQAGAIRIDGEAQPGSVATDRVLMWDGAKIVPGPSADEIATAQGYAEAARKWAIEAVNVPVEPGLFSAFHYATQAAQSAAAAATSQAAINLPTIPGGGLTFLQSLADGTGYRHRTPQQLRETDLLISGIGASIAATITNLNPLAVGGTYYAASTATGLPVAEASVVIHQPADTTSRAVQEVVSLTSGRRWWRVETGGTWGAWVEVNAPADNRIINGAFDFWQRGLSSTAGGYVAADRWINVIGGGTVTMSRQAFAVGDTLGSNSPAFYLRQTVSGQTLASHNAQVQHRIEGVRSYAGQTITVLGWARRISGSGNISLEAFQNFGTGGSPSAPTQGVGQIITLTNSFAPFAVTINVPSVTSRVLGTNGDDYLGLIFWTSAGADFNARTNSLGLQTIGVDLWGIHIRLGTHTVSAVDQYRQPEFGPELVRCQRYYEIVEAFYSGPTVNGSSNTGFGGYAVSKRAAPGLTYLSTVTVNGFPAAAPASNAASLRGARFTQVANATIQDGFAAHLFGADSEL